MFSLAAVCRLITIIVAMHSPPRSMSEAAVINSLQITTKAFFDGKLNPKP